MALLENLPEVEARRHASTAQVAWLVHSALSKSRTRVQDWLPAFAQTSRARGWAGVPRGWREDVRVASERGFLSQALLDSVVIASEREEA